jgi:hypothetical protein
MTNRFSPPGSPMEREDPRHAVQESLNAALDGICPTLSPVVEHLIDRYDQTARVHRR